MKSTLFNSAVENSSMTPPPPESTAVLFSTNVSEMKTVDSVMKNPPPDSAVFETKVQFVSVTQEKSAASPPPQP